MWSCLRGSFGKDLAWVKRTQDTARAIYTHVDTAHAQEYKNKNKNKIDSHASPTTVSGFAARERRYTAYALCESGAQHVSGASVRVQCSQPFSFHAAV